MADTSKNIILITGANTGIGWETVKALLLSKRAYHVLLGTRDLAKGQEALEKLHAAAPDTSSTVEVVQIDVSSDDSISKAFKAVEEAHGRIDALVNNAGIALDAEQAYGDISMREAWNRSYDVNVTGSNITTHTFLPLLLKSADPRLIFVTSGLTSTGRMSQANYPMPGPIPSGWPKRAGHLPSSYRVGKSALSIAMLSWHWTLHEDGVKVWAVSPGYLATGLGGERAASARRGAGPASMGGELLAAVLEGENDADVGKIIDREGIQLF